MKNCLMIPKLTYFTRTTPLWLFPSFLDEIDTITRNCLESLLNISLDDISWTQACLPIRFGGIGIRKLRDICIPAFLSSAYGVFDFVTSLFPFHDDNFEVCHMSEALDRWNIITQNSTPPSRLEVQKEWDDIVALSIRESIFTSCTSDADRARLLALQSKEAGSWLQALPSPHLGTLMDNNTFKISIALRLGCKICLAHQCRCGAIVDSCGHHPLNCTQSKGRFPRHSQINDILKRALTSAGIPSILEPSGISRSDGKRPDGVTLIPWSKGKSLMWDATCVDTFAPSHLSATSKATSSAAEAAVINKRNKYRDITDNYIFVVFAVETMGAWCKEATDLVFKIGRILSSLTGDPRATEYLRQRIGIAIQRGNATSILGAFPESSSLDEIFL